MSDSENIKILIPVKSESYVPYTTASKSISWVAGANFVKEPSVWNEDSDGNTIYEN